MTRVRRFVSSALFALGVMFVFAGISTALGITMAGMVASVAAIATLLYAGGAWFARSPLHSGCVLVFDHALRITCGGAAGTLVSSHFATAVRREIEARCVAALNGHGTFFTIEQDGTPLDCHAAPVRAADGTILYGVLLSGAAAARPAVFV